MSDLISRPALYENTAALEASALDMVQRYMHSEDPDDIKEREKWSVILQERTAFKHDVADAPSVQPEPKWIPVIEPPEHSGRFLCYYETEESGEVGHCIDFGIYGEDDGWYVSGVKYWMPLPDEPYERREDE